MKKSARKSASKVAKSLGRKSAATQPTARTHVNRPKVKDPMAGHGASRRSVGKGAPAPDTEDSASAARQFPHAIYQDS